MKALLISLFVFSTAYAGVQLAPSFEDTGEPFATANCDVVWSAPRTLWIYKTIPQHFSDEVISNLVAMGSFTARDKRKLTGRDLAQLPAKDRPMAKNVLAFVNKTEDRNLTILPAEGYIYYRDQRADPATRDAIEDVPNEAQTQELALKFLDQFSIPRSELARKPDSPELQTFKEVRRWGHMDKQQGKRVELIESRGVFYVRQIDGVAFAGIGMAGGFHARFASHAKVAEQTLVWRNLQRYKIYEVASPGQVMQWIKDGKAAMPEQNVYPSEVKKLTITDISLWYMGASGETRQDFTYPFADLRTIAETGETNIGVQLYCPILSKNEVQSYPVVDDSSTKSVSVERHFDQVRVGMTKAEVERLLGPGSAMLMSDSPETMLSWSATPDRPPKRWLNVYFGADGRVIRVEHMPATSK